MGIYAVNYSKREWGVAIVEAKSLKAARECDWEMTLEEFANDSKYEYDWETLETYKKKYGRDYYG